MLEKISVNKQSSIRIATDKIIYFDPYCIENEPHDADVIFFTHPHPDHFSPEDFVKVAKKDTVFVAPKSMEDVVLNAGIEREKIITVRPGDVCTINGIATEVVAAYNIGKPMHPKKKEWVGYVISVDDTRIYVCGDTDAIPEGKNVNCDIALVPIGGFFTMGAKTAANFVNKMKPKCAIPIHYGSVVGKVEDAQKFKDMVDKGIEVFVIF